MASQAGLVPPNNLLHDSPSPSSSPSISFSSTITTDSSASSVPNKDRPLSEEAAIVSIYSMYGDENLNRNSWNQSRHHTLKQNRHNNGQQQHNGFPNGIANGHVNGTSFDSQELAYLQLDSPAVIDLTTSSTNSRDSHYNKRSSTGFTYRTSNMSPSTSPPPLSSVTSSYSPSTRYSSTTRSSVKELPHIPPSQSSTPRPLPIPPLDTAPPPQMLDVPSSRPNSHYSQRSRHSESQSRPHSQVQVEDESGPSVITPPPRNSSLQGQAAYMSSPESKTSLVPSEGEDMDAFHVRSTYAQLDVSGVKGDGYEDGVERTRARVGGSRASQLNALAAIGDGTEKKGDLDERELAALASVDRYGFFSTPSHDRLILLSSAPLTRRLTSNTPPGPQNASTSGTTLPSLPPTQPPLKETSRIGKWTRMVKPRKRQIGGNVEAWTIKPSKEPKLRERTYKGIPDRWRHAAWELFMSRSSYADMCTNGDARTTLSLKQLEEDFVESLDKPSTYDIQIDLDVPRTISGHVLFRTRYGAGQRSLFHVLHCFSLRCSTCGYVQGMGPIAATLLCYFPPSHVYAALVRLHSSPVYALHTIFAPGFPGLLEAIYVQEQITKEVMPSVYKAFGDMGVSTTSYATKWYITMFANTVTFQTQLRMWDAFLLEGKDVFVVLAVGVVWVFRDQITSSAANFETVLSLLSSFFVPEDENALLSWVEKAMGDKKLRANMSRWRTEWGQLVKDGKEGTVLL
ncbi:gtpase activating protein [Moniliophthora roreri MCA 2997]|uniref:Gtpase activating protein n=2 Tax=Moniliophthora roreri TaxID=221103 RepID=V2XEV9_MONRO|nr:gtpase activating protein [Moniliophthora roreri MCA 2997]KAI3600477.1 gtpase activating protein [Moniliophthora roreri]